MIAGSLVPFDYHLAKIFGMLRHFPRRSKRAISLVDQKAYLMTQEDCIMEMKILCKWNGNFRSNQLEQKKWRTSKGRPSSPENFRLICAYH